MASVYHEGQLEVQARVGVEREARALGRIVRPTIPPVARAFLEEQRIVVAASAEASGRVWASLLAGPPGFLRAEDERTVRIDARPAPGDPLLDNVRASGLVGLLAIEFATRRRMRLNGRGRVEGDGALVVVVEQVFANCPKYIQAREIAAADGEEAAAAAPAAAPVAARATALSGAQRALVERADTLFVASARPDGGADASHRGGRPGFLRAESATRLVWPDYAGNNMFLTLGNVHANPRAGLLVVDFEGGRTLQATGRARIDWDPARAAAFPGSRRVIEFDVEEVVEAGLAGGLRWRFVEASPFNPPAPGEPT